MSQFQSSQQAMEDGLFDLCLQRVEGLLKKYPQTELKAEAKFLQAKSYFYLGQYEAAQGLLKAPAKQTAEKIRSEYLLLQSETAMAREDWANAENRYRELLSEFPKEKMVQQAQLGLAMSLIKQQKESDARQLLQTLIKSQGKEIPGQRAALYLALLSFSQKQYKEAITQLEALRASKPRPEVLYETHYWLGEALLEQQRWAEAVASFEKVTGDPKAFPKELVAKACLGQGSALEGMKEGDKTLAILEKAYLVAETERVKLSAFRHVLDSARKQKRLPEVVAKLQEYASKNPEKSNAAAALYSIALAYSDNDDEAKGIATLEAMLVAYPKSPWRAPIFLQLGRLYQNQNRVEDSLQALKRAMDENPIASVRAQIQFELGEIHFRQKNYTEAIQNFERAAQEDTDVAERSLFNILLAQSQQGQLAAFTKVEERFLKQFPNSPLRDKLVLEKAALFQRVGQNDEAKKSFEKAIGQSGSGQQPLLQLRYADLLYQSQQYEEASQLYEKLAQQHPDDTIFPEAAYKAIFAGLATKKVTQTQSVDALLALLKRYPKHPLTPSLLFSLGEAYYQQQDFGKAQAQFETVVKDYLQSDLADEAAYWSGKAAVGRGDLQGAVALLEKVPDASPYKPSARLLQGRIYHQQTKFEKALQLFEAVLEVEKQGRDFTEAILRKGDCLLALGASDAMKYEQAVTAYTTLIQSKQASPVQLNEAGFKRAKCLEKLNRKEEAVSAYLDVIQGRLVEGAEEVPEFLWRVKAGLEAAEMKQAKKDWRGAIAIYRKLEQIGGPNQQEFRDAVNRIKRENFIYDDES